MRGNVVKTLRREAAAQERPLRDLKRAYRKLDHRQRGRMIATYRLISFDVVADPRFWALKLKHRSE